MVAIHTFKAESILKIGLSEVIDRGKVTSVFVPRRVLDPCLR
jgi:hypothetical protein